MEAVLMEPLSITVADGSHVSAIRIALQRLVTGLEFDATRAGRVAIVATEAVTNMVRHGGGGTFAARPLARDGALGVEMLAIDAGPGMGDFPRSSGDGYSTGGTPGTGLGAIGRLADEFEVETSEGRGTILRMVMWNRTPQRDDEYLVGAVTVPKGGETASGDAWAMELHAGGATFLVVDGLGHGPDASRAAGMAVDVLRRNPEASAVRLLDLAHAKLRPSRGAALAFIRHERSAGEVAYAGVGNIAAVIIDATGGRRAMVSHNGIVGHNVHRSEEYRYPWPRGALLVAHSDGLESQWDLAAIPGIMQRHPSVIAAALFRRHTRKRDDTVVLVARENA
jgi:anti-sigma regulatory factor (Ser/Thr protein kinase)